MATPKLIGTVLGAVFGSIILLFLIYQAILYMREEREEYERVNGNKTIDMIEKEVFLPHQIESGVPMPLQPVRRHDLQRDIECKMSESYRTGVIQIVVEADHT